MQRDLPCAVETEAVTNNANVAVQDVVRAVTSVLDDPRIGVDIVVNHIAYQLPVSSLYHSRDRLLHHIRSIVIAGFAQRRHDLLHRVRCDLSGCHALFWQLGRKASIVTHAPDVTTSGDTALIPA